MAIFKCKICGGSLEIDNAQSVATCEYCGTKQTLPKLDNERRANLYDRANHFRRNNDFDKAMGIYENILNEDNTDAEAYWSIVLCRYGIEYVEDPATHKRVPTVNRAQFTSIFDDEDYKSAIANADGYQREIYEAEATAINEIQKGILAISQQEEPFDVFVCYKETDTSGRRTQDSVLATELYHELTREGFKVFFSRITLEDKLGVAYEPYIFAALHSAKVMVVLGTRPEHFNAVWVKNEWSRYLALIKNGAKKTLIPAYRDMDPYDLPEEFSHLQAQDMSKLGFMQDLTRGIKKIVEADAPKATVKETIVATAAAINVAPLLKRAFMFLEDGDFDRADEFCEQVLNQDPENAQAYLGKLMAELRVKRQTDLVNCAEPFDSNKNYEKAIRFADAKLSSELRVYVATIKDRNAKKAEEARKEALYLKAMDDYKSYDIIRLQDAIKAFTSLAGYKDSDERIRLCQAKIDQIRIKEENDRIERERLAEEKRIADEKARLEGQRQAEIDRVEAEKRAKRNKKIAMIATPIVIAVIAFIIVLNAVIIPNGKYNDAVALMNDGKYEEAISAFEALDGYKDSETKLLDVKCAYASSLIQNDQYEKALTIFSELDEAKSSYSKIAECEYEMATLCVQKGKYVYAYELFSKTVDYKDSKTQIDNIELQYVAEKVNASNVKDTFFFGSYEQDNNLDNGKEKIEWIILEKHGNRALVLSKYCLDYHTYHTSKEDVTWETSKIREWLNTDFYKDAFSTSQITIIETTNVHTEDTLLAKGGNDTFDKLFLLSENETKKYFPSQSARQATMTAYGYRTWTVHAEGTNAVWGLRSPSATSNSCFSFVNGYGEISDFHSVDLKTSVRVAMWIDTSRTADSIEINYQNALTLMDNGEFTKALTIFESFSDYKDSKVKIEACKYAINDNQYNIALGLIDSRKFDEAISVLETISNHKDSAQLIQKAQRYKIKYANVGDVILLGTYEQDNDTTNGKESIEWYVVGKEGNKLLLISKYALDYQCYSRKDINGNYYVERYGSTWETCDLRNWLNNEFYTSSFSNDETSLIASSQLINNVSPIDGTNAGPNTTDKIFVLSTNEFDKYVANNETFAATQATEYAVSKGAYKNTSTSYYNKNTKYWLRTPGQTWENEYSISAIFVGISGSYGSSSMANTNGVTNYMGVRPAMWIDIDNIK